MQFPLVVYSTNQNGAVASLLTRLSVLERAELLLSSTFRVVEVEMGLKLE